MWPSRERCGAPGPWDDASLVLNRVANPESGAKRSRCRRRTPPWPLVGRPDFLQKEFSRSEHFERAGSRKRGPFSWVPLRHGFSVTHLKQGFYGQNEIFHSTKCHTMSSGSEDREIPVPPASWRDYSRRREAPGPVLDRLVAAFRAGHYGRQLGPFSSPEKRNQRMGGKHDEGIAHLPR